MSDAETWPAVLESLIESGRVANLALPGFGVDQIWLTLKSRALPLKPQLIVVGVVDLDFERSQVGYDAGKRFVRPWFMLRDGVLVRRTAADTPGVVERALDRHSRLRRARRLALQALGRRWPIGEWWTLNAAFLTDMLASANGQGFKSCSCRYQQYPCASFRCCTVI